MFYSVVFVRNNCSRFVVARMDSESSAQAIARQAESLASRLYPNDMRGAAFRVLPANITGNLPSMPKVLQGLVADGLLHN
jgi:hypothetical protein